MTRREFGVEDHHGGQRFLDEVLDVLGLARPDQGVRIRSRDLLVGFADDFETSRVGQEGQLLQRIVDPQDRGLGVDLDAHKERALDGRGSRVR